MDFNNSLTAFKLSKFKIPKKIGSGSNSSHTSQHSPGTSTSTKKLYHKGPSATTHLKPYLKPRPQKLQKNSKTSLKKKSSKDPLYTPFKTSSLSTSFVSASVSSTSTHSTEAQRHKNDRYYEDLYDNVELEQQFVLRLPLAAAAGLRSALQSEAPDIKDRLGIEFQPDLRKASVRWDGYIYPARFQNLPCVVESYKTVDNKTLYKTADLSGVLTCRPTDDFSPPQSEDEVAVKEGASKEETAKRKEKQEKKHFNLNHGLTPPLKNVRKRRFRKVLKKKYETAPEIEKEVRRLFRMDNEAASIDWELIPDGSSHGAGVDGSGDGGKGAGGDGGAGSSGAGGEASTSGAASGVQIEDIFGGQLSSSDSEEEEWDEGRSQAKVADKLAAASLESQSLGEGNMMHMIYPSSAA